MSSASSAEAALGSAPGPRGEPPILVLGLGNPLLGDDGVGWCVVDELERHLDGRPGVEVDRVAVGGLALMERIVGYRSVILVDALSSATDPPGTLRSCPLAELETREAGHLDSAHDVSLPVALATGRALGAELPHDVTVVGIAVSATDEFHAGLSEAVGAAVVPAAGLVLGRLQDVDRPAGVDPVRPVAAPVVTR